MRHQKKRHKLGRSASHRKATLAALGNALIEHKRITTTVAKAKALRTFIEPLITRCKDDTTHNRRQVFRRLQNKHSVTALFTDVSTKVGDRPGGYTRVVKLGRRAGDGAALAMIELVDYNDVRPDGEGTGRKRTRRGAGRGRKRTTGPGTVQPKEKPPVAEEDVASADAAEQLDDLVEEADASVAEAAAPAEDVEEAIAQEAAVPVEDVEEATAQEAAAPVEDVEEATAQEAAVPAEDVEEATAQEATVPAEDVEATAEEAPAAEADADVETAKGETVKAVEVEEGDETVEAPESAAEAPKSEKPETGEPATDEADSAEKKDQ